MNEVPYSVLKGFFEEEIIPFIRVMLYQLIKSSLDTPVSLAKAAEMMGVKKATLKKRCQRGDFPYKKIGNVYYISTIDVNIYLDHGINEIKKYNSISKKNGNI